MPTAAPAPAADAQPPDVICFGLVEVINDVQMPRMPTPQRSSEVTVDYYRAGGSALTVAVPLAVWGLRSAVLGNHLGEDAYADLIWSELQRHPGISSRWLQSAGAVRTPFTRIFVMPDRERFAIRYWHSDCTWTEVKPDMLAGGRFLSTDVAAGQAAVRAAGLARSLGLKVVTSDVVQPEHALAALSDIVVTSVTHLQRTLPDFNLPELAADLHDAGAGRLIVTNGADPVQVFEPGGVCREFPSFPLPPVDRTGAGDIFKAGCLCGLARGWDLERAIRYAAAAAAVWIAQPTPLKRPPTPAEISALLAERAPQVQVLESHWHEGLRGCPLCQRAVETRVFEKHWQMEQPVVEAIRRGYPGWRRADGACPRCIHEHQAVAARLRRPGAPLVLDGHPIYGNPDLFVLPTPVRLRANPHYTGQGVTMAFLDSGFYPHPDLTQPENRIVQTVDATTDDIVAGVDFREPRGVSWHGLMTSAAAAGSGALSNGRYAGIASAARVVLIKISDQRGRVRERDITRGLRWLLAHHARYGVDVVNISVGGDRSGLNRNSVIDSLVKQLVSRGVVVVAASGNAGQSDLYPPASAAEAITVGGIDDQNVLDRSRHRMYESNWGRRAAGELKPEVVAPSIWLAAPVLPGTRIAEQNLLLDRLWRAQDDELSTLLASTHQVLGFAAELLSQTPAQQRALIRDKMVLNKFVTPYYQHVDGTSFAAPIVSSVVAQMLEANRDLAPDDIKRLLIATAQRLPNEPVERQGHGVVTPGRAVAAALRARYEALIDAPLSPYFEGEDLHFLFYDERAQTVAVIGDFNDWRPTALPMHSSRRGRWSAVLPAPPAGRYHYKFLIDGERWMDDPENGDKEPDGYGGFNAVVVVEANGR